MDYGREREFNVVESGPAAKRPPDNQDVTDPNSRNRRLGIRSSACSNPTARLRERAEPVLTTRDSPAPIFLRGASGEGQTHFGHLADEFCNYTEIESAALFEQPGELTEVLPRRVKIGK